MHLEETCFASHAGSWSLTAPVLRAAPTSLGGMRSPLGGKFHKLWHSWWIHGIFEHGGQNPYAFVLFLTMLMRIPMNLHDVESSWNFNRSTTIHHYPKRTQNQNWTNMVLRAREISTVRHLMTSTIDASEHLSCSSLQCSPRIPWEHVNSIITTGCAAQAAICNLHEQIMLCNTQGLKETTLC